MSDHAQWKVWLSIRCDSWRFLKNTTFGSPIFHPVTDASCLLTSIKHLYLTMTTQQHSNALCMYSTNDLSMTPLLPFGCGNLQIWPAFGGRKRQLFGTATWGRSAPDATFQIHLSERFQLTQPSLSISSFQMSLLASVTWWHSLSDAHVRLWGAVIERPIDHTPSNLTLGPRRPVT